LVQLESYSLLGYYSVALHYVDVHLGIDMYVHVVNQRFPKSLSVEGFDMNVDVPQTHLKCVYGYYLTQKNYVDVDDYY